MIDTVLNAFRGGEASRMDWRDMRGTFLAVLLLGVMSSTFRRKH